MPCPIAKTEGKDRGGVQRVSHRLNFNRQRSPTFQFFKTDVKQSRQDVALANSWRLRPTCSYMPRFDIASLNELELTTVRGTLWPMDVLTERDDPRSCRIPTM